MKRRQKEDNPARIETMRKAASLWSNMDLDTADSQDYTDLYEMLKRIYLEYDP
jgi:hypothetical protein